MPFTGEYHGLLVTSHCVKSIVVYALFHTALLMDPCFLSGMPWCADVKHLAETAFRHLCPFLQACTGKLGTLW